MKKLSKHVKLSRARPWDPSKNAIFCEQGRGIHVKMGKFRVQGRGAQVKIFAFRKQGRGTQVKMHIFRKIDCET